MGSPLLHFLHSLYYVLVSLLKAARRNLFPVGWQPRKSLHNQVVLVTGAGGGIGRELAVHFAQAGCHLILWDVDAANNEKTAEMVRLLDARADAHQVDITDRQAVYRLARLCGPVDVLVNNAGLINTTPFLETSDERIERLLDVNVKAVMWTIKAFLPAMIARGSGHLVCMSSVAGVVGASELVSYIGAVVVIQNIL